MLGDDPAVAVWVGFGSGTTIGRKMVLAKGPGRPWQLGMLTNLKKLYLHGNTGLKREPPAVSRLLSAGSLIECELGLQAKVKAGISRTISSHYTEAVEDPEGVARRAFRKFDLDCSGEIDRTEFIALLGHLDISLSKEELREAMDALDRNGDGTIGCDEFVDWFVNK